jgi:urease alpha subunit
MFVSQHAGSAVQSDGTITEADRCNGLKTEKPWVAIESTTGLLKTSMKNNDTCPNVQVGVAEDDYPGEYRSQSYVVTINGDEYAPPTPSDRIPMTQRYTLF